MYCNARSVRLFRGSYQKKQKTKKLWRKINNPEKLEILILREFLDRFKDFFFFFRLHRLKKWSWSWFFQSVKLISDVPDS
jgi:hypothetical protein